MQSHKPLFTETIFERRVGHVQHMSNMPPANTNEGRRRMTRSRTSARQAGARFERSIADHLAATIDDRIDRRVKTGAADKGDIGGLRTTTNHRVVVECKDCAVLSLPAWTAEAHAEADNDHALVGVVISKRRGVSDPGRQWVHMEVNDLVALLTGRRP